MTGTYQGTYHGGNDFTGESVQQVHENLKQNAILNGSSLAFVRAGWSDAGFTLDTHPSSGSGPGNGVASARGPVVSGGPGAGTIGATGSVGAGNRAVYVSPGKWFPGGSLVPGGRSLGINDKAYVITPMVIGGMDIQHDTGWSDVGAAEQAWGESDGLIPGPTAAYQWLKFGADMKKTVEVAGPAWGRLYATDAVKIGGELSGIANGVLDAYTRHLAGVVKGDEFGGTAPTIDMGY